MKSTSRPSDGKKKNIFEKFSARVTALAGSSGAFLLAFAIVLIWALTGPLFGFSETWQLVINTGTTIVTFLMVFLIQKSQNKDSLAIQLKLNELVASNKYASNRLVSVEDLTEEELHIIQRYYSKLSEYARQDKSLQESHSIDEAKDVHNLKARLDAEMRAKNT